MFTYRLEIRTNIGKIHCNVAAASEEQAFSKAREALRREAPSIRVKGMTSCVRN